MTNHIHSEYIPTTIARTRALGSLSPPMATLRIAHTKKLETDNLRMETQRRSYNPSTTPGATMGAGNVFYVSHPYPSQSAFSCSDTPSLMSDSSFDKSFLKRMIHRGKVRFSSGTQKGRPTSSPEKTDTVFEMTPSPSKSP